MPNAPRVALLGGAVAFLLTAAAFAQDVIAVGAGSGIPGATAQVPLFIRDRTSTPLGSDAGSGNRIQAVGLKISCSPATAVSSMSIARGGVTQNLTPLYETAIPSAGAIGWLVSFAEASNAIPLTPGAPEPGDPVGSLSVGIDGTATPGTIISLTITPATAVLSNQTGMVTERTVLGSLSVANGSVTVLAPTTTALTSSRNPAAPGQTTTFTAVVSSATSGTIGGNVAFKDGGATLGSVPVAGGQAVLSTSALTNGLHSITAEYSGDATFGASTSNSVSQSVASPPSGILAAAVSESEVHVTWNALAGVDHYDVYRSSAGGAFTFAGTSGTAAEFHDAPVTSVTTHLYYVVAAMTNGATSPNSSIDPATTVMFEDPSLQSNVTPIRAVHIEQLRKAINAFRISAGKTTIDTTAPSGAISASHITYLRTALAEAREQLGLVVVTYLQPSLTSGSTFIKRNEIEELRGGVQ